MSVHSMTGFGHGVATRGGLRIEVDASSVNRKQLDVAVNLPKPLAVWEARITEAAGKVLARGRVTVQVHVRESAARRQASVQVDAPLAAAYLKTLRATARKLRLADDFSAISLMQWPGVVRFESAEDDVEALWPLAQRALQQALRALARMRAREGAVLARDVGKRLDLMRGLLEEIRRHAPAAVARYREALRQRVASLRPEVELQPDRLEREVVLFAERADISEELTRLHSHQQQAAALLRGREPAGRALDFVAQEMYREINTIGAKANDAEIAQRVVLFKTELDRFREQVQNIE